MNRRQLMIDRYARVIESTARQIRDMRGLPAADKALREAMQAIRKDAARGENIG